MKSRAAVAWEANKPLTIETIEIGGPKAGEVLVEVMATGVCHTDAYTLSGLDSEGKFPAILGHEGAGIVREVGAGVTSLKVGDHVIPLYTPECRQCKTCLSQRSNLCTSIRSTQGQGLMPDKRRVSPAMAARSFTIWDARPFRTSPSCRKSRSPRSVKMRPSTRSAILAVASPPVSARSSTRRRFAPARRSSSSASAVSASMSSRVPAWSRRQDHRCRYQSGQGADGQEVRDDRLYQPDRSRQ